MKSNRPREEFLPELFKTTSSSFTPSNEDWVRLVSPAHKEGQDWEYFVCGQDGKHRVRSRASKNSEDNSGPERGDFIPKSQIKKRLS
jgi:hypothetical protein